MKFLATKVYSIDIDIEDIPDLDEDEDALNAAADYACEIPIWEWDEVDFHIQEI